MNTYSLGATLAALLVSVSVSGSEAGDRSDIGAEVSEAQRAKAQQAKPQQGQKPQAQKAQKPQKPQAGGRGQGQQGSRAGQGQSSQGNAQAAQRGQSGKAQQGQRQGGQSENARSNRGRGQQARAVRRVSRPVQLDRLPERMRPLARSSSAGQRAAAVAVARGSERSTLPVRYTVTGDRVRLMNDRDELLLDISDDEMRGLGYWDVRRLDPQRVRDGAPSFCRSGEGHPVWGREWCIEKGFGLGASDDWLWGRHNPDDVIFRRPDDRRSLDRGGLIDVLGSVVFDRLALHALTLGLTDPLAGRWMGDTSGPRVMVLNSGDRPVAELIDLNRDGHVDVLYVTSR